MAELATEDLTSEEIARQARRPPVCALCSGRHWFLEACGAAAPSPSKAAGPLAATATADEIERALKLYRKKREQARDRMRKKRAAHQG